MAYAVLGSADLSKMQEKQTILAALGVTKGLVATADNNGLRSELTKGLGVVNPNVKFYAEQVDKLAEQFNFDMDNINLSWIGKFLPLVSVATTVHYNSHLIDQVIGVAKATFGPEPIVAKQALTNSAADSAAESEKEDKSDNSDSKDKADENSDKSADNNESNAAKDTEVSEDVADQFGEEPKDPTKGAETQESYDFHTEEDQASEKSSESKSEAESKKEQANKDS